MEKEKIQQAKRFIKAVCSQHNVALALSGGKDSTVLDFLCREANVKVDRFYNNTTIDPPGTLSFVKKHGAKVVNMKFSFLDLVEKKGFPTQFRRFCCDELKKKYYASYVLFGIRKNESIKREKCYSEFDDIYYYSKKVFTNRFFPILYFTDQDLVDIIEEHSIECHPKYYDELGRFCVERRLGCIGCPLKGDRGKADFMLYPILLKQLLRRGILFHKRLGRTEHDAALNLVYNIFYSNHKYEKFLQTYQGLFFNDPWELLYKAFGIDREDVMSKLPLPKF